MGFLDFATRMVMMMSFCSLYCLELGFCASSSTPQLPTSAGLGQLLATLAPFTNSNNNLTLTLFLRSNDYLYLASLRRSQEHRLDINTTTDFCEIDVQKAGILLWKSECAKISLGNNCSATLSTDGNLQVLDGSTVAWSSNTAGKNVHSVELTNSGNLTLTDSNNATIWMSSDHIFKDVCLAESPSSSPTLAPTSPGSSHAPTSSESPTAPASNSPSTSSQGPSSGPPPTSSESPTAPASNSTSTSSQGPSSGPPPPPSSARRLSVSASLTSGIIAILLSAASATFFGIY